MKINQPLIIFLIALIILGILLVNKKMTLDSKSVEKNGVTMTISPTKGPIGSKVKIVLTGIKGFSVSPYAALDFKAINGFERNSDPKYTIDTRNLVTSGGRYETTYTIPDTIKIPVSKGSNLDKDAPTALGEGYFLFHFVHETAGEMEVDVPFEVTNK